MPSKDSMWHMERRKEMLKRQPELKNLDGPFYWSFPIILVLVGCQWGLWWLVHVLFPLNSVTNLLAFFALVWVNANTFYYMLSTFIHENSHGLILGWNQRLLSACIMELGVTSFGEQWHYTVTHYTKHHPHLNDAKKDSECPEAKEGGSGVIPPQPDAKWRLFLDLLPLGPICNQIIDEQTGEVLAASGTADVKSVGSDVPRIVLLAVSIIVFGVLGYRGQWVSILFAAWTASLYSSRWCISLHGQSIAEHYRLKNDRKDDATATSSTYFGFENLLGFNTGYHDEHHTFPNVPWYHLPKVRENNVDYFSNENRFRYAELWFTWARSGFDNNLFRICKE